MDAVNTLERNVNSYERVHSVGECVAHYCPPLMPHPPCWLACQRLPSVYLVPVCTAEQKMTSCDSALEKITSQMADLQSTEECASTVQKMCRTTGSGPIALPSTAPSALDEGRWC